MTSDEPRLLEARRPARAVLIPVFNEFETISCVLDEVARQFDGEIIVVDDGSTDGTGLLLGEFDDVTVLRFAHNQGYGSALRAGFDLVADMGIEQLVTMDCDGQHEPQSLHRFFAALDEGWDIVSGSRYLPESEVRGSVPADRMRVNASVTACINEVTGWALTDSFCGFKGYRVDALKGLDLTEPGYAFPLELWAKAYGAGLSIIEIPVDRIYLHVERSFGEQLDDPESREVYYRAVWREHFGR